jgi:hypothetical protein
LCDQPVLGYRNFLKPFPRSRILKMSIISRVRGQGPGWLWAPPDRPWPAPVFVTDRGRSRSRSTRFWFCPGTEAGLDPGRLGSRILTIHKLNQPCARKPGPDPRARRGLQPQIFCKTLDKFVLDVEKCQKSLRKISSI